MSRSYNLYLQLKSIILNVCHSKLTSALIQIDIIFKQVIQLHKCLLPVIKCAFGVVNAHTDTDTDSILIY